MCGGGGGSIPHRLAHSEQGGGGGGGRGVILNVLNFWICFWRRFFLIFRPARVFRLSDQRRSGPLVRDLEREREHIPALSSALSLWLSVNPSLSLPSPSKWFLLATAINRYGVCLCVWVCVRY